ncbi:MAG: hypothetical protein HY903_18705 [Deltaproteobacteria bacterium]|nr:hypothetical protein [Deltaproteobacteria bacterium]
MEVGWLVSASAFVASCSFFQPSIRLVESSGLRVTDGSEHTLTRLSREAGERELVSMAAVDEMQLEEGWLYFDTGGGRGIFVDVGEMQADSAVVFDMDFIDMVLDELADGRRAQGRPFEATSYHLHTREWILDLHRRIFESLREELWVHFMQVEQYHFEIFSLPSGADLVGHVRLTEALRHHGNPQVARLLESRIAGPTGIVTYKLTPEGERLVRELGPMEMDRVVALAKADGIRARNMAAAMAAYRRLGVDVEYEQRRTVAEDVYFEGKNDRRLRPGRAPGSSRAGLSFRLFAWPR